MSDKLLQLYDAMVAKAIDTSLLKDNPSYVNLFNAPATAKDPAVLGSQNLIKKVDQAQYNTKAPYPATYTTAKDPLVQNAPDISKAAGNKYNANSQYPATFTTDKDPLAVGAKGLEKNIQTQPYNGNFGIDDDPLIAGGRRRISNLQSNPNNSTNPYPPTFGTDSDPIVKAGSGLGKTFDSEKNVWDSTNQYPQTFDATSDPLVKTATSLLNQLDGNEYGTTHRYSIYPIAMGADKLVENAPSTDLSPLGNNTYTANAPYDTSFAANNSRLKNSDTLELQQQKNRYNPGNFYSADPEPSNLRFFDSNPPANIIVPNGRGQPVKEAFWPAQAAVNNSQYLGGNQYSDGSPWSPIAPYCSPGMGRADVFALANWVRLIAQDFGIVARNGQTKGERLAAVSKGLQFLATQATLFAFNPNDPNYGGVMNNIYNPLSIGLCAVPGLRGFAITSPNAAAALTLDGTAYSTYSSVAGPAGDRHLLMRKGVYEKGTNATDLNQLNLNYPGFIGDVCKPGVSDNLRSNTAGVSVESQMDQTGLYGSAVKFGNFQTNTYTAENPYSQKPAMDLAWIEQQIKGDATQTAQGLQLKNLFKNGPKVPTSVGAAISAVASSLQGAQTQGTQYTWIANTNQYPAYTAQNQAARPDNYSQMFPSQNPDGTVYETAIPTDDDQYMPFWFQDLRDVTPCVVFLRAFLKEGLEESFDPNWQTDNYYGRVDEVPVYKSTARRFNISFDVVAWDQSDIAPMWTKLHKLASMTYPSYDTAYFMQAGPICRLRIGDLVCSNNGKTKKGLPGYISSLNFAYDDNIWNITTDFKIPRKVTVTMEYTVLHEGNPGVYKLGNGAGIFGAIDFAGDSPTTVYAGSIRGIQQTIDQNATGDSSFSQLGSADPSQYVKGLSDSPPGVQ